MIARGRQRSRREGSEGSEGAGSSSTGSWFRFRERSEQSDAGDNNRWVIGSWDTQICNATDSFAFITFDRFYFEKPILILNFICYFTVHGFMVL